MECRDIEYIRAIVRFDCVSKAAEALAITQPALSGYIKKLEHRLGAPVFERVGKKMILTRLGEMIVAEGENILFQKQQLENSVHDMILNDRGRLRIGLPLLRGISLLPVVLPEFMKQYPHVEVIPIEEDASRLEKLVLAGDVDFAVFNCPIDNNSMEYVLIKQEEIVLCTHQGNPLAARAVSRAECRYPWLDITLCRDEPFILNFPEQRTTQIAEHIFRTAGFRPHVALKIRSLMTTVSLSAMGLGMSFASEKYPQLCIGMKPAVFSIGSPSVMMNLVAAYRRGGHLSKYASAFIGIAQRNY